MNTQVLHDAFLELYPHLSHTLEKIDFIIKYSRKFSDFNANISYRYALGKTTVTLGLSAAWKDVDSSIQKGLVQSLFLRVFKKTYKPKVQSTDSIQFYESFCKQLANFTPITKTEPLLQDSFERMNATYFENQVELTNLTFGQLSFSKLGSYNYQTDTITISPILKERMDLLDFVMFHEMLHKKHKYYTTKTGKNMHHHTAFRTEEQSYPNYEYIEKELSRFASAKKRQHKRHFFDWL